MSPHNPPITVECDGEQLHLEVRFEGPHGLRVPIPLPIPVERVRVVQDGTRVEIVFELDAPGIAGAILLNS